MYDKNLKVLKEYRPNMYEKIRKYAETTEVPDLKVESLLTRTLQKALMVTKDGVALRLNSKYNPNEEAEKWAEQFTAKNLDTVFTMFGFGNGLFVTQLAEKLQDDNFIVVYEPCLPIFLHAIQEYDLEEIIKNEQIFLLVKGINEQELPKVVAQTLTWMNLFSKKECLHPGYDKLFAEEYTKFKELLQDNAFSNVIAKNTYGLMGRPIVENQVIHLKYLRDSISVWDLEKKLPKDTTIIIAAAGPSLNKNIEQLRRAKGHAVIVAVDRAYESFIAHNIEPDFVVVLDALKELKYCGNMKGFTVPLLYKHEASDDILSNHDGKKIIYGFEDFVSKIFQRLGKPSTSLHSGGSVATSAFGIFASLGFKRIVLIGCDLAYAGEKAYSGVVEDVITNDTENIRISVEDIYGNTVGTRYDWYSFLRWFENAILQLPDADIIDATEGGAKIKGARIMTLEEVIDQYCNTRIDCAKLLAETPPGITEADCDVIYDYLSIAQKDLVRIKKLAKQALKDCNYLTKQVEMNKSLDLYPAMIKSISETSKQIEEMPVYELVNYYVLGQGTYSVGNLFFMTNNKKNDDIFTVKSMTSIFRLTVEACDHIMPKLEASIPYFHN